jgi:hypothetical protein
LFQNDPRVGTVFDLKTLPSPLTFTPKVRVGVCDLSQDGRILHLHGNDPAVVLSVDLPTFCQTTSTSSTQAPSSMFALAAHELASWLTPKPAYAASRMMFAAFGGGTVGGFSLIGPIQVLDTLILSPVPNAAVSDTALSYDNDPLSNQFGSGGLTVLAQTKGGHNPLAGVLIKLTIVNNKGSFVPSPFETATTDETGIARFPRFFVDKAGGYTITASAPDDFGTAGAFVSNLFNVNGQ